MRAIAIAGSVIGLGACLGWAAWSVVPGIEADLRDRAAAVLAGSVHPVAVSVDGRRVVPDGLADTPLERTAMIARLEAMRGVAAVDATALETLPPMQPFVTQATKRPDGAVALSGGIPTEAARAALGPAAAPLTLASGAADGWLAQVRAAQAALEPLHTGEWTLTDGALRVDGIARTQDARAAALAAVETLETPVRARIHHVPVVEPYTTVARKTELGIEMTGFAPALGAESLLDHPAGRDLVWADHAPDGWARTMKGGLAAMEPLVRGTFRLSGDRLFLGGVARDDTARTEALDRLSRIDPGARSAIEIVPRVDPFVTEAVKTADGGVRYDGYAPHDVPLGAFGRAAWQLRQADYAPDDWSERLSAGLAALEPLAEGHLRLEGRRITLTGKARTLDQRRAAEAALAEFDTAVEVGIVVVPKVLPFVTTLRKTPQGAAVAGHAPYGTEDLPDVARALPRADGAGAGWAEAIRAAEAALAPLHDGTADLRDGALQLAGIARSEEARDKALAALAALPGAEAQIDVVPEIVPFTTAGQKRPEAPPDMAGYAPYLPGAATPDGLTAAAGAPADWDALVAAAQEALGALHRGRWQMKDRALYLSGVARTEAARQTAEAALDRAGFDRVTATIVVVPELDRYRTSAAKQEGGGFRFDGFAPGALQAERAGLPADALAPADGAPDRWAQLVAAGQAALGPLARGAWQIDGDSLALSGVARTEAARDAALAALRDVEAQAAIEVIPRPQPFVTTATKADGNLVWSGFAPHDPSGAGLPDLTRAEGAPQDWRALADAAEAALAPLRAGAATISDRRLTLVGEAPDRAARYRASAALAALPEDVERRIAVTVPLPDFRLSYTAAGGAEASGALPGGFDRAALAQALGLARVAGSAEPRSAGAEGRDAAQRLAEALGPWLPHLESARLDWRDGAPQLAVRAGRGVDAEALGTALREAGAASVTVDRAAPAPDGARRINAATGRAETGRNGYWLPALDFDPSPGLCANRTDARLAADAEAILAAGPGGSPRALAAVDALAVILRACFRDAGLVADLRAPAGTAGPLRAALVDRGMPGVGLSAGTDLRRTPRQRPISIIYVAAP